ncbi:MAG: UDP-3-O-acyl-N-acetylglucosamine deacetylase [Kiritimatiellae bacterium]|nr:UDP-3-O-acyl-N-acetylglucosamine deacetylase [Kiritimatiellia bacterium]
MIQSFSYPECRLVAGDARKLAEARRRFADQAVDEVRFAPDGVAAFPVHRTTLKGETSVTGVGTFRGREKRTITFGPSSRPGWWIRRTDLPEQLDTAVDVANLWTSARNLVLRSGSPHNYLRMVEHIVALKAGLGLDDVVISTNSGDPPLFDQSSFPLVDAVEKVGVVETDKPVRWLTVKEPLAFAGTRGDFLLFLPDDGSHRIRLDVAIDWRTIIGKQRVVFDVTPDTFRYASYARTNATHRQYQLAKTVGWLFADTRNLGYDKNNILIHGRKRWYGVPRFPLANTEKFLEPVWHRATLDLLAALSLTGPDRFCGTVVSFRSGHTQDCDAVRALYRRDLLKEI